ncbi:succinate dehydrogenase flavoprotein subunit [Salmonella enterica subsp. enterica serovar Winslow]|nr:succinate dehydrogenase flavoprotein subunit [Salmonella enterica]ECL7344993.1 succinate dehydrogenase flavoprotein subunit [Salmonella enterica subsp. enterica serovar Menston]ELV9460716.1 succinate dehydrogenase flavoprotein subunit [Salmonella enterica]MIX29411.1 succinate dehydrogenase flavoprotein subunit [Salmonella enterica subsp. enterica serovar Livingstone]
MIFDPLIVAQAKAFVNALKSGHRAHMPALRFEFWQQFMTTVNIELGNI